MKPRTAWNESTTYKPIFLSWLGITAVFIGSHVDTGFIAGDPISVTEFAQATAVIWAIWVAREGKEALREKWANGQH